MSEKKTYKKSEGYKSEDLLQSAYHHFAAAQKLLDDSPELFDSGGYLLHLSVELIFKSWLFHVNEEFKGTHILQDLRDQVLKLDSNLRFSKRQNRIIERLDNLYELRYPNRLKPTEIGSEDLALAKEVLDKIVNSLPESLYSSFEAIPYGSKGGRVCMERLENLPINFDLLTKKQSI